LGIIFAKIVIHSLYHFEKRTLPNYTNLNNFNTKSLDAPLAEVFNLEKTALFDILVGQNANGMFYLEDDVIIYANNAFTKVLNTTSLLIQGKSLLYFLTGNNKDMMKYGIDELIKGEREEFQNDFVFKDGEGTVSYFSIQLKIQSRKDGKLIIIGSSHDVTARVLKNKKAQDSKAMFDALYCNIVDGILIYDYNKEEVTDCNEMALKIFKYETKEDLQKYNRLQFIPKTSPIFPGSDLHEATKDHGIRVCNGEAFKTPGVFIKANGEHMIVHVMVVPTFRAHGEAFIIFQDSTKRIMAKKAQRTLEKRYREIFDNSHEGIVYMDAKTFTPIMCNEQSLHIFGVNSFSEFTKLNPNEYIVDDLIEGIKPIKFYASKMEETVRNGRSESIYQIKSRTGEIIRVSIVMICDKSDRKDPKVICFMRDVTNLHKVRVALNEKNTVLEKYIAANLQLENFAYFASHDLQTPLRSIISFTQLEDVVKQLHLELTTIIEEKNAKVILQCLPNKIMADTTKIRQIFQNLITNAVKFSNAEKSPEIKITCQENKTNWQFSVADNGIGIHPDFQERIFLLFKRLHNNNEYEGTGIGLAMVKKIVEQHNGKIWLESAPGEGSTFYFTIKKQ